MENSATNKSILISGKKKIDLGEPRIMGILNLTNDSFFDGGQYNKDSKYLKHVEKMLAEGAHIIDIGAASTRPGSIEIPESEELKILSESLLKIRANFPDAFLSIDTCRSQIAQDCVNLGADMINDISGGTFDEKMPEVIANLKIPFILMHTPGKPQTMQINPTYRNVVAEIKDFFIKQLNKLENSGVTNNVVLDPGFGFGKTLEHNYKLLAGLSKFTQLGYPVLAGVSRKSMINRLLEIKPQDALNGTTVVNTLALLNGASILRVHDVKEAAQTIKIINQYKSI